MLSARGAKAATLGRYPYLQTVTDHSAVVVWTTEEGGRGEVRFSEDRSLARSVSGRVRELVPAQTELRTSFFRHSVELTGLKPNTTYYYRVLVDGLPLTLGDELTFRTAGPGSFQFLVMGDSGSGSSQQQTIARMLMGERADFLVHTGDLAYPFGAFADYHNHYFDVYRDLMKRCPFFPCPGNHGYMTGNAFPYLTVHQVPTQGVPSPDHGRYYSFDWGNAHFVSLDSNLPLARTRDGGNEMLDWLEADLKANAGKFWKIAIFHHPPYAGGPNETDPLCILAREKLVPILERHGVQLVLSGHEHSYQRSHSVRNGAIAEAGNGATYLTSGGGGIFLYPVNPHPLVAVGHSVHHYLRIAVEGGRLSMRAIGLEGEVFDRLDLAPAPELAAQPVVSVNARPGLFAPGGLVSVFGRHLGFEDTAALAGSTEPLAGVTASVNGIAAKVLFSSPGQVNLQIPYGVSGDARLALLTANGELEAHFPVGAAAPGILAVAHLSGEPVSDASPAIAGEPLILYAAGLGEWDSAGPRNGISVAVDGRNVPSIDVTAAAGMAGVHTIRFTLPGERPGPAEIAVSAGGFGSPTHSCARR